MANDLHRATVRFARARDNFLRHPASILNGVEMIESSHLIEQTIREISQVLWTLPVIVHVAGTRQSEPCDDCDDGDVVIQRCKRCGSTLHQWHNNTVMPTSQGFSELTEDDVSWWEEDELVAKATINGRVTMYAVEPGRSLDKHEMECVSLVDIGEAE